MRTGLKLKHLEISLNNFCSLSCRGCPSLNLGSSQIKVLDFSKVIEKLQHIEIEEIVFCGNTGEPFEVENLEEILFKTINTFPQTKIQVSTNGEKIHERFGHYLNAQIRDRVFFQVALDGPNQEIHTKTRHNGNFTAVISAIEFLIKEKADVEVVYSRHEENERFVRDTEALVKKSFGLDLVFRDTTLLTSEIRPPQKKSSNGNVSVLYSKDQPVIDFNPPLDRMYITQEGEVYPCVAFVKNKTNLKAPSIYQEQSWIEFYKEFLDFKQSFCQCYRKIGDLRQCVLNCKIYPNFAYDHVEDIS